MRKIGENFTISANPESVDVLIPSRGQVGTDEKRNSILPGSVASGRWRQDRLFHVIQARVLTLTCLQQKKLDRFFTL